MVRKKQSDRSVMQRREISLTFSCFVDVPKKTSEKQLIFHLGENGITWSPLFQLLEWKYL